jgi:gamma-glutamylcyclotransferase (GGCT)/AIG2-like uncharacterized protein YtfP
LSDRFEVVSATCPTPRPGGGEPTLRGEVDAILGLVNAGRAHLRLDEERAARKFCDALNRAWNARARLAAEPAPESDWSRVKELVTGLPPEDGLDLLRSPELRALVAIDPPILNHRVLLSRGFLGSTAELPEPVRREAAEAHLRLRRRVDELPGQPSPDETQQALVRLADLVYVIRSNLQHGEKFASADPARLARDRLISERAARMLELFFDLAFARPSTALATYGSLAPGGEHHPELDRAGGHWMPSVVRGRLRGGRFPKLTPMPGADPIRVQLLRGAEGLPGLWQRLDEIEGAAYERILVPAETDAGELVIANLYAGRDMDGFGAFEGAF